MRLRDLYEEIGGGGGGAPARTVPRIKSRVSTSFCAGNCRSYAYARRERGAYFFDRACFCSSPEEHSAQFFGGGPAAGGH